MPLLLERLRIDYGNSEPAPPPYVGLGFVCTHVHLVDALRAITNTDQGMFYPRWSTWWEANRIYPRLKWMLDGFTEIGLHAVDPPDEQFGLDLIEVLGGNREHHATNASRLLKRARPDQRSAWTFAAAESANRRCRLGALRLLDGIDTTGHDDLIRKLTNDSDPAIRDLATSILAKRELSNQSKSGHRSGSRR